MALRGKSSDKQKKLHKISGIVSPDGNVYNSDECCSLVAEHYNKRMGGSKPHMREVLLSRILQHDGLSLQVNEQDVGGVFSKLSRKDYTDTYGVCVLAFQLLFDTIPAKFCLFINCVLASTPSMSALSVVGKPFGKKASLSTLHDVWPILSQGALMSILDVLLANKLNSLVGQLLSRLPGCHTFIGARPRTQILDITHACQTAVEKGIDNRSECAIAQNDVEKYYDNVQRSLLLAWLFNKGGDPALITASFRHQACTSSKISFPAASSNKRIHGRHTGGLTRSRVAVALFRIPIDEMILCLREELKESAFLNAISVGTYGQKWNGEKWKVVTCCRILGHCFERTGSIDTCFHQIVHAARRQFWKNIGRP